MQGLSDLELVREINQGNNFAFESLISRYSSKAYNLAVRITRSHEDAEEVVQDAFTTIYRKLKNFRGDSQFSSWFYRITMNCALMKLRTRKRHRATTLENAPTEESAMNSCDLLYLVKRTELQNKLEQALDSLPQSYRQIFVLRDIEGVSNEEASQILDVSVTALKSRLHRARLMLRKTLKKVYNEYYLEKVTESNFASK